MVLIDAPQESGQTADLTVTGHQWWWDARYPNGVVATGDIHIPVGRRLLVRIESTDVIHDFWAPELARKMDAVPGRPSYIWLEADRPGTYSGACSEFCGAQHAWMRFRVIAEPEAGFEAWLQRQAESPAPVLRELRRRVSSSFVPRNARTVTLLQERARSRGKVQASRIWLRVSFSGAASRGTLPRALALWLTDPQAAKPGNRMPDTPLSADERDALLAYLETLR